MIAEVKVIQCLLVCDVYNAITSANNEAFSESLQVCVKTWISSRRVGNTKQRNNYEAINS